MYRPTVNKVYALESTEPVFLNFYEAQEKIPRIEFRQPM